jgi:hypothetical protein
MLGRGHARHRFGIIGGDEPQVHPSPMPDVDLVTITVGGNDVVFSSVVQLCLSLRQLRRGEVRSPGREGREDDRGLPRCSEAHRLGQVRDGWSRPHPEPGRRRDVPSQRAGATTARPAHLALPQRVPPRTARYAAGRARQSQTKNALHPHLSAHAPCCWLPAGSQQPDPGGYCRPGAERTLTWSLDPVPDPRHVDALRIGDGAVDRATLHLNS